VRVVDNPRRIRPAGLNTAIGAASGDIIVRVDARTALARDYVERCVSALDWSGAAIVGGQMRYEADDGTPARHRAAMTSRLGAGPAASAVRVESRATSTRSNLGAFRARTISEIGGYDEWSGGNEDAELAWRAQRFGGVYLDPSIRSYYLGRDGLGPLARQFYRYGHNRARDDPQAPGSLSWRQLAVPALLSDCEPLETAGAGGLRSDSSWRGAVELTRDPHAVSTLLAAFPTMHAAWGLGSCEASSRRRARGDDSQLRA